MKRLLFMIAIGLAVTAVSSQAQSLQATQIQLQLPNQSINGILVPPTTGAGGYTWTLPAASGTLSLGGANAWEVGGQALGLTGLLGSTDAQDVSLIAGGTTLLTLDESDDAVLIPPAAQLRLGALNNSNWSAIESPDDITPDGTNAGNITYIYPETGPGGVDVRMKVKSITVSGNDRIIEFDWTNPNTTGQIGFQGNTTPTCNNSAANTVPVTGMTFEVESGGIYSFEAIIEIDGANQNADITWGTAAGDAQDAAVSILYRSLDISGNGNPPGGNTEDSFTVLTAGNTYILKGYMQIGALATSPYTVQLRVRRAGGPAASQTCITAKSAVQLISE